MVYISHLISCFNKHFEYVNEQGKRKGLQLFPKVDLTDKLVQLAIKLRNDVDTLLDGTNVPGAKIDFADKAEQFLALVNSAYETSLAYRKETGTKPAKFEKQLIAGMNGILKAYPNLLASFNIGVDFDRIDSTHTGLSKNLQLYLSFKERSEELVDKINNNNKEFIAAQKIQQPSHH